MTVRTGDKSAICDLLVSQSHSIVLTLVLVLILLLIRLLVLILVPLLVLVLVALLGLVQVLVHTGDNRGGI